MAVVLKYSVAHQVIILLFTIDQYMAFGISGDDTRTFMVGADVVVTWVDEDGPEAVDYYLTGRVQVSYILFVVTCVHVFIQCRGGEGVCPDTLITEQSGTQDVTLISGDVTNDRRCVEYQRPLNSSKYTIIIFIMLFTYLPQVILWIGIT